MAISLDFVFVNVNRNPSSVPPDLIGSTFRRIASLAWALLIRSLSPLRLMPLDTGSGVTTNWALADAQMQSAVVKTAIFQALAIFLFCAILGLSAVHRSPHLIFRVSLPPDSVGSQLSGAEL